MCKCANIFILLSDIDFVGSALPFHISGFKRLISLHLCDSPGVTGGLAAPLVAAGATAVLGAGGAAALGSATGIAIMASLFGAAGAGLTGL